MSVGLADPRLAAAVRDLIDRRIEFAVRNQLPRYQYGVVEGGPDPVKRTVSVRLYGLPQPSPGFVYGTVAPRDGDHVRVFVHPRGDRYIDGILGRDVVSEIVDVVTQPGPDQPIDRALGSVAQVEIDLSPGDAFAGAATSGGMSVAFDNNDSTWIAILGNSTSPIWDAGAEVSIDSILLKWSFGTLVPGGGAAASFRIDGSHDASGWTVVLSDANPAATAGASYPGDFEHQYVLGAAAVFRYWRISSMTSGNNDIKTIRGLTGGGIGFEPAPEIVDGDDPTYHTSAHAEAMRVDLTVARRIVRTRIVIASATAGAKSYALRGSNDPDFDVEATVATLAFTAAGAFATNEVTAVWNTGISYRYFRLVGPAATRRLHTLELYEAASGQTIVTDPGSGQFADIDAALQALQDALDANAATDLAHLVDTIDAHDASAISIADAGANYTAADVEAALAEVMDAVQAHDTDGTDAHDASAISIADAGGNFGSGDVEGALAELAAAGGGTDAGFDVTPALSNAMPAWVKPTGSGVITADPQGRLTIDSGATYKAFPGMTFLEGVLYLVYRDGSAHNSGAGLIKFRKSYDLGRTWTSATTIVTSTGTDDLRDPNIVALSSGRLLISYDERNPYTGTVIHAFTIYSDDRGASWSTKSPVTTAFSHSDIVSSPPIELPDGTILLPGFGDSGGFYIAVVWKSTDGGATFGSEVTVASGSRDYEELQIRYLSTGTIVGLIRSSGGTVTYRVTSTDLGATWSAPASVLTAGGRPDFVEFYPGALLLFCRTDNASTFDPRWAVSWDSGATWTALQEVDTGVTTNQEYAALVVLAPGYVAAAYGLENSSSDSDLYLRYYYDGYGIDTLGNVRALTLSPGLSGAAGGDLSGTYPNPSVVDDSHAHTAATLPATGGSTHFEPVQFDDGSAEWPFVYLDGEIVMAEVPN